MFFVQLLYPKYIQLQLPGNTIKDLDFHSPFDNTYDLGKPFLVEYDNTTRVQAGGANKSYDLQAVFSGYGILNGTSYTDVGVSSIDYRY